MQPYLSYAADLLMIAASLGAALYCLILSRRLTRLTSFDKGIGGAIAVLSSQVDEMKAALGTARAGTEGAGQKLEDLVRQAHDISGELELMIAACHDFAEQALIVQSDPAAASTMSSDKPEDEALATDVASRDTPAAIEEVENSEATTPVFGTRRQTASELVFLRHAQG